MNIFEEFQKMENKLTEIMEEFENGASTDDTKFNLQQLSDEATLWKFELEYDPNLVAILNALISRIKAAQAEVYNLSTNTNNI